MKTRLSSTGMALGISLVMVTSSTAQSFFRTAQESFRQLAAQKAVRDAAKTKPDNFRLLDKAVNANSPLEKVVTYYWPVGHEITIAFIGGTKANHDFVKKTAAPWFEHANLTAKYVTTAANAEVRIKIVNDYDASYSELGTTALTVPKSKHTMQLSFPPDAPPAQVARAILHEFGHMLGLLPENSNPNLASTIVIDWARFYRYARQTWGLDETTVDANFGADSSRAYLYAGKPFDIDSIMMHPIPEEVILKGPRPGPAKAELSPGDIAFISKIYPRSSPALAETQAVIASTQSVSVKEALQKSADVIAKLETTKQEAALVDSLTDHAEPAPSSTPANVEERSEQALSAAIDIVKQYLKVVKDTSADARKATAEFSKLYMAARESASFEEQNKAIFGLNDQYSPEVYQAIYKNSDSVGSLTTKGKERLGTAFMIGKDLVLTCNHCLEKAGTLGDFHQPSNLMVDFSTSSNDPDKRFRVQKIVFQGTVHKHEGVEIGILDYALLELGANKNGILPSACEIQPLSINSDQEIAPDVAAYVVGFPGKSGTKTVADNARIFAGFSNNELTKAAYELRAEAEAQLLRKEAEERKFQDELARKNAIEEATMRGQQIIARVKKSFKSGSGSSPRWFFISELMPKGPPHPAFALDSDTFHGNSGSPVFSRSSSDVIGVLFRGIDDRHVGVKVGWDRHEEAIPIHVILENWKNEKPGEPDLYNVTF